MFQHCRGRFCRPNLLQLLEGCVKKTQAHAKEADGVRRKQQANKELRITAPVLPEEGDRTLAEHDKETAQQIRLRFLRHARKQWMDVYTEVRNSRRMLFQMFMLKRREGKVGLRSYEACNAFFATLSMPARCEKIFGLAQSDGIRPSQTMWNQLLGSYAKHGNVAGVLQAYRRARAAGVVPTMKTALSLLVALVRRGDKMLAFAASVSLLARLGPSSEVYTQLLSICNEEHEARAVFEDLQAHAITLEAVHYTSAIQACFKSSNVPYALELYHKACTSAVVQTTPLRCALLSVFRRAGDVEGIRFYMSRFLTESDPSPLAFYIAICTFSDVADISSCRMTAAAANSWNLSGNLKTVSRMMLAYGMLGNAKNVLRIFESRPLGKYTGMSLKALQWALKACLIWQSPSPRFTYARFVSERLKSKAEHFDHAVLLLSYYCYAFRGYGHVAVTRLLTRYDAETKQHKGSNPTLSPGVYRFMMMAYVLKAHDLPSGASRGALVAGALQLYDHAASRNAVVASLLVPPLAALLGAAGTVAPLLRRVRALLAAGTYCHGLRGHFDVFRALFEAAGDREAAALATAAKERFAAQALTAVMRDPPDFLADERAVVSESLVTNRVDRRAAAGDWVRAVRKAPTVSEALALIPGVVLEHDHPPDLPDKGLLLDRHVADKRTNDDDFEIDWSVAEDALHTASTFRYSA
ncbi:hypothetical protein DIPPA_20523 [Diplonema papillatum]|nr:hypothetical protein DIPPA_20523 [Diplonema papillatum]